MGRINSPFPNGVRHRIVMSDKATLTFDVFEPENPHPDGGMSVCNNNKSVCIAPWLQLTLFKGAEIVITRYKYLTIIELTVCACVWQPRFAHVLENLECSIIVLVCSSTLECSLI